jgi:hypothetical protein
MSRAVSTSAWQRFWRHRPDSSAVFIDRCRRVGERNHLPAATGLVGIVLVGTAYAAATRTTKNKATADSTGKRPCLWFQSLGYVRSFQTTHRAQCESEPVVRHFAEVLDHEFDDESGYTEAERFYQCLDYHRSLLSDYTRRWGPKPTSDRPLASRSSNGAVAGAFRLNGLNSENSNAAQWPRNIPLAHEVSALECDLRYCQRGSKSSSDECSSQRLCQDAKFRIAAFYMAQSQSQSQQLGFQMLKELAESSHADGMCYYGESVTNCYVHLCLFDHV